MTNHLGSLSLSVCVLRYRASHPTPSPFQPDIYQRFEKPETTTFCQRVMVGTIILYDHVHLVGAFSKKNPSIDIRASIKALKMHANPHLENLLNALRFSTKHLNDDTTPKEIKKLLA